MIRLERRDGRPLRIGHRGAATLAPENTLRSFRVAVETGVDLIEFDVLALRSGELVIAHSNDLHEVSHGTATGSVRDLPLARLREVCPELPTLDDALAFFVDEAPETGVHLDLKSAIAAPDVVAALARFGLLERTILTSFHRKALLWIATIEPGLRIGYSFPRDRLGIRRRRGGNALARAALWGLRAVSPLLAGRLLARSRTSALAVHHTVVSRALVRRAHAHGASVLAWTVDEPGDLARVVDAGVDAVVTNDPRILVSTLQP